MISGGFGKLATVTATTQRMGAIAGGLSGDMADSVVGFKCTPLDPLTPEVATSVGIGAFVEALQTFAEGGLDILEGDTFITGGITYKTRAVGEWTWRPTAVATLAVVLEEVK